MSETIEERNKRLEESIEQAMELFDLESDFRDFIFRKILVKYMPDEDYIKDMIKEQVEEIAQGDGVATLATTAVIENIIDQKIEDMAINLREEVINGMIESLENLRDGRDY